MDPQEHFLIISAGDSIHKTYPAVLDELRTVTHTIIFAEKESVPTPAGMLPGKEGGSALSATQLTR